MVEKIPMHPQEGGRKEELNNKEFENVIFFKRKSEISAKKANNYQEETPVPKSYALRQERKRIQAERMEAIREKAHSDIIIGMENVLTSIDDKIEELEKSEKKEQGDVIPIVEGKRLRDARSREEEIDRKHLIEQLEVDHIFIEQQIEEAKQKGDALKEKQWREALEGTKQMIQEEKKKLKSL